MRGFLWKIIGYLFLKLEVYKKISIWDLNKRKFKSIGTQAYVEYPFQINGHEFIAIGDDFHASSFLRLEAMDLINGKKFSPQILIGNNVDINRDCHIGCVNKIVIGDNVLIASKVYITDHVHGLISPDCLKIPPSKREIISKGPVIIEDNVWIGENVVILPNVTVGRNSVIGASAVVTKDVLPNSVVIGIPGQSVKCFS